MLRALALLVLLATPALAQPFPAAPAEPAVRPQLPARADLDLDNNRIDDRLDYEVGTLRRALARARTASRREALAARLAEPRPVELVFSEQVTQKQIEDFLAMGGTIGHLYRSVSYGWSGTLPAASIDVLSAAMGDSLHVVAEVSEAQLHMDEATRTGRVRPVWASGFAGNANGFSGTSDITIGIIDSGVDDSHTDLAGRAEYWKDFSGDNEANPRDVIQHGSHVAGIALGTGAAYGSGDGTLRYTDSGNLTGVATNSFFLSPIHVPAAPLTFTLNSTWLGGGSTLLRVAGRSNGVSGGFISICNTATAGSPLNLVCNTNGNATQHYSSALPQSGSITRYATTVSLTGYLGVGDGFNSFRGVAPGARWAGAKVFTNAGSGTSGTIGAGLDDLVSQRVAENIKVVNMSLGIIGNPGLDATLRAKANSAVNNGIVVVASAGNDGPGTGASNLVDDPGRAALVLTVGATNDANALTRYTSSGFASPGSDEDSKPDLLAPGGSDFYSHILSVDSNDADASISTFADRVANDYYNIKGTSMAAPFAAGSAALVIDAMQKAGTNWTFSGSTQPLFVKMLLCASSTETNANREVSSGSNPTLGRAATPKDLFEGYGLLNPDAAVEAVSQSYTGGTLGGSSDGGVADRRAWGRRMGITSGPGVTLTLTVGANADYDLYLYSASPDAKGNPVIRASSTNAGAGVNESITFTPTTSETRYLFIKRVSGSGDWSLTSGTATASCGDGNKSGSEQCDDGNQVAGDCCSPDCTFESGSTVCRAADGACDAAETCTGTSGSCPADGFASTATTCRAAVGACDAAEKCTGSSRDCPADGFASTSTVCRASAGVCDAAENCTGTSNACPANTFVTGGTTCRGAASVCDVAETCTGSSAACPNDVFAGSATVCREANGVCDVQETCTGTSGICPANGFAGTGTTCRPASGACDAAEVCSGTSANCPADGFLNSTTTCRAANGVCDAVERCSGTSNACPADGFASSTTTCRSANGACDVAETCTGTSNSCPADGFAGTSTVCRAAASICDVAETCTGTGGTCPANAFAPSGTTCRSVNGVCDVQESCTGSSGTCPADSFLNSSTTCRAAGGVCDSAETCSGSSANCPADTFLSSATTCRAASGVCDAAERCTGTGSACPADAFASAATTCRVANGVCDVAETCTGTSNACPADAFAGGTICRPAVSICDVAEKCTSTSGACPGDVFAPADTVCRGANGVCDVAETCTNNSATCPADSFASAATTCRAANGACDVAETCTGNSAGCPADGFASTAITCRAASGVCDAAETCTGNSASCPADAFAGTATVCRAGSGACDSAETCTGSSNACPADAFAPTTTVCRTASGVCDVQETCNGTSAACPADAVAGTVTSCRASAGECDLPESCNGSSKSCPADVLVANNTGCSNDGNVCTNDICNGSSPDCQHPANSVSCNDGLFCNGADTCGGGTCSVHAGDPCAGPDGDANCSESCNEATDACTAADSNGSPCNDGLFCNGADTCSGGTCSVHAGDPCPGPDGDGNCSESCNEATDTCTAPDPNASPCNDGLFCTANDTCSGGTCLGSGDPCPGADGDGNCAESCSEAADACTAPDPNASPCNDGLFCTLNDACSAGSCVGSGDPCPGADGDGNCAESCNEATDACTAADSNGSPCNDGLFCNGADTCSGGACSVHAGNPCPGPDGDGNCAESCSEATDTCTAADPNSSPCNDGLACTSGDACQGGVCTFSQNSCGDCGDGSLDAGEQCDDGNTANGDCCSSTCTPVVNGTPCNDGLFCNGADTCQAGSCSQHAGDPCPGPDGDGNCSESCNEAADSCSSPDSNGAPCNDGLFCNGADTCQAGSCSQHAGDPCPGADGDGNCSESCNETADACSGADPNGTACNDGLFCNGADTCQAGSCSQHAGNPCTGPDGDDDCSESCNESIDNCTAPDPGGSACDDGLFCNGADTCAGGTCSVHAGSPCPGPDGDGNCAESCREAQGDCAGNDPNGSACNDNAFCNGADTCQGGSCSQHAGDPCQGPDGDGNCAESCNEGADACNANDQDGSACNDGLSCTSSETCTQGSCLAEASEPDDCEPTTTTTLDAGLCGDANADGRITAGDALTALRTAVGTAQCPLAICDYNGDGRVAASDALAILRTAVGQNVTPNCAAAPTSEALVTSSTISSTSTTLPAE